MSLDRAKICPVCGAGNDSRFDVCRKCGASLTDVAPSPEVPASRGMVKALRISAAITFVVCFFTGVLALGGYAMGLPQLSWVAGLALGMLQLGLAEGQDLLRKIHDKLDN